MKEPQILRDKNGLVTIKSEDGNAVYYSLDGKNPTKKSALYKGVFQVKKAVTIKAAAIDAVENISSAVKTAKYGASKENWKIVTASSGDLKSADRVIDGNPNTDWSFGSNTAKLPQEIVIDMGVLLKISGFTYVPQQVGNALNLIANYEFYTSKDAVKWTKQSQGEFSNIKNNPIEQLKIFTEVKVRYLRFVAKSAVEKGQTVSIGEINVIEAH